MKVGKLLRGKEKGLERGEETDRKKKRTERGRRKGKIGEIERENTTKLSRPT
jgi:hypothetical protein